MALTQELADISWMLLTAALVMLMQAGFCCLESGLARAKNSINVAIKNLSDFCVASVLFWAWGFGLMFGDDVRGLIGTSHFFPTGQESPWLLAFFLFQLVFCGTSTTIVSGAVAERMKFCGYLFVSAVVSGLIYPVIGHWVWGGVVPGTGKGWLAEMGFIDFAGCTVVHSVGGWVSLVTVLLIGPRIGRFHKGTHQIHGYDYPLATLGTMLLWFGWFGFNGGSTLAVNGSIPIILINTNLSAGAGGMAAIFLSLWIRKRTDVGDIMNGCIGGLVGITASCQLVSPAAAILIGAIAAAVVLAGTFLLEWLHIDDVVGAIPVHAGCGMWGTLAVALFGDPAKFTSGLTRWEQLGVQLLGISACAAWSCGAAFLVIGGAALVYRFRVSEEDEIQGLNVAEHGASTELIDLLSEMHHQSEKGDFTRAVPVEPHTEVGQIAHQYNRVLGKVVDEIARREQVVDKLLVAEEKYRSIFEHSTEGIFRVSPEGRFFDANPALARIAGYADADALFLHSGDLPTSLGLDTLVWGELLDQLRTDNTVTGFETRLTRPDGSCVEINVNARLHRDAADQEEVIEGSVSDITQRAQAERFRQEKEAAESASRAKSAFLATMSHEIRTPLNGVIGMLDLLSTSTLTEQQVRYATIGKNSAQALLSLINDILDFSKIESGKLELNHRDFSLPSMIEEVAELFAIRAEQKGLELLCHLLPDVPSRVIGDDERIRQVLINLLGNALKFTERGEIRLAVRLASVTGNRQVVRMEVHDTGPGIPEKVQSRLFQVFEQADNSTTRKYGGTGLGLAICRQLVELMKGQIGVISNAGEGSTFWLEIPFETVKDTRARHLPVTGIRGRRVLAVDDNEVNLQILRSQLTDWQAEVQTAESAIAAHQLLREAARAGRPFDLLLLDHQMPEVDGLELARRIREDVDLPNPVIVLLTSSDTAGSHAVLAPLGISACCHKPILRSRLFDVLMNTLHRPERQTSPSTPASVLDHPHHGGKVLIVDDNEINQMVALEVLERHGYQCHVAGNGAIALDILAKRYFDVVLMDCQMPVMDGFTAAKEIRRLQPAGKLAPDLHQPLPIIALTANAVAGDRERCLGAGMSDYVSKPIEAPVLLRAIGKCLSNRRIVSSVGNSVPSPVSASAPVRPNDDSHPIDWQALRERCGGDVDFMERLLEKFRARVRTDVENLRLNWDSGQLAECRGIAHSLKGAAASLSANGIARQAAAIEALGEITPRAAWAEHLETLETRVTDCLDSLQEQTELLASGS